MILATMFVSSGVLNGKKKVVPEPGKHGGYNQSGGGNQKWPTYGQSGYVTAAVSGIPTAAERGGGGSKVAHKWAKWLRHPCRLGEPHCFRAGGKIRSGPLVGKVATSQLPSRGSPPLQSGGGGGGDQKWPTSGQSGYITPAVSGIPTAATRGGEIRSGPLVGKVATSPLPSRGSPALQSGGGGGIRSGPQVGKVATSPLPSRGSPPLQSGGGNQKWPTSGQEGYVTPAVSGIPTAAERGGKSEVAHKWARWPRHPCHLGDPQRFRAGGGNQKWPTCGQSGYLTPAVSGIPTAAERGWGGIRSGPQVGKVATSPLLSRGSPPLQSGGQNQKWPTSGQSGYLTPAVSGIPTAAERGWGGIRSGQQVGKVATSPLLSRGSPPLQSGGIKSEVAHKWAKWLCHPRRLGDPHRCRAGGEIRSGPQVGKVATSALLSRGSQPLQSGGQNQKWPTSGESGYVNPAVSGIPTAAQRGGKSEMVHLWAKQLCHPCRLGDPHRCKAGGGGDQKWPTSGQSGYVTLAVSGIPTASERGAKSEVAHLWAKWLRHSCRLGDPHRFRAGGGGGDQNWPTSGQCGYVTPAVSGIPTAAERGAKSEAAHKWAKWLRHPCRLRDPKRCRGGGGGDQKWPTSGQCGYLTPAISGIPTAAERGGKSEVAHKWAKWLPHPCRLGDPHRCRAEGEIRSGPQVGKVATSPLAYRGSPPLQSGGQSQKRPTSGQSGYVTPAVSVIPTAAKRGGEIRSGPQVGKVATSPLLYRGSPPLQSGGGGNHKWPTNGQSGYATPAVSGIPTACETE